MFPNKKLKQLGIDVIGKVEDEVIIDIAKQVATKLTVTFPNIGMSYLEIFKKIIDTPMYYANISNGIAEANFYYKNSSIYFSSKSDLKQINEYIFHECIHCLQEQRNRKGKLIRMGLCEINELSVKGTALNEAAIQYIVSKVFQNSNNIVTIYNITLPVRTKYYTVITNLISQIAYLIGEDYLVDSTINSNENFKFEMIDNFGEIEFINIQKNLNKILEEKNKNLSIQQKENNNPESIKIVNENIQKIYIETQNLIFTSYFQRLFKRIDTLEEVSNFIKKLHLYRELIGTVEGYNDFDLFCIDLELKAEKKSEKIINNTSLAIINNNIFFRVLRNLKKLFNNSTNEYNK